MTERKTLGAKARRLIKNKHFLSLIEDAREKYTNENLEIMTEGSTIKSIREEMEQYGFILPPIWNSYIRSLIQNPDFPFVAVASRTSAGCYRIQDDGSRTLEAWEDTGTRTARAMAEKLIKIDKEKKEELLKSIKESGVNLKEHPWSEESEKLAEAIYELKKEKTFKEIADSFNGDDLSNFENYWDEEKVKRFYYQYCKRTGN